jgi:hypothetical protein
MADKQNELEVFKDGLEDLIVVLTALAPLCEKTTDLISVLRLATENDGQSKLLMKQISNANKK